MWIRDVSRALWPYGSTGDTIVVMANAAKILQRMRANPRDWRIEELQVVARHFNIDYSQHRTSHCTFRHPACGRLTVPASRPIKSVYVREFVEFVGKAIQ